MAETKFQTSFIPKKPLVQDGTGRKSSMSLFLVISILIFLASIGAAGYVFLQNQFLISEINNTEQQIETNKSSFDTTTIDNIVELNSRINTAETLLANHIAVSPIFAFLQKATLQNVQFTDFTFSADGKDADGNTVVTISMSGTAKDFETVASQADEFQLPDWSTIITQPVISGLTLNANGSVSFTFTANIVPAFLTYTGAPQAQSEVAGTSTTQ